MLKKNIYILFKVIFSLLFIFGGIAHFTNTSFYLPMMPKYLPMHLELIYLSGVVEVALGLLLLIPKYTHLAGKGLILLLIAVFPANLNMYLNAEQFTEMDQTSLLVRLPIQLVLIFFAYKYSKK